MNASIFRFISPCDPYAARWCLALLKFNPEDGGDTLIRNVGLHADYTTRTSERGNVWDSSPLRSVTGSEGPHTLLFSESLKCFRQDKVVEA
jgi:hypothetical protein